MDSGHYKSQSTVAEVLRRRGRQGGVHFRIAMTASRGPSLVQFDLVAEIAAVVVLV